MRKNNTERIVPVGNSNLLIQYDKSVNSHRIGRFMTTFLILFSFGLSLLSQGVVSGHVYSLEEGKRIALPGANVYWLSGLNGVVTDGSGAFQLPAQSGELRLVASFVGYVADTLDVSSGSKDLVVELLPAVLDEVTVAARSAGAHLSRLEAIATVNITSAELGKAACCNLSESFETNPSVDVAYSDAATGARQIQLLGLAGRYVQMLTENFPNQRGLAQPYGLSYIPGPWMHSIQVSKGTSSVINGYEALTGQINVELKKPSAPEYFNFNLFGNSAGRGEMNLNASTLINDRLSTGILAHVSGDAVAMDDNHDGFLDEPQTRQVNLMNRWEYKTDGYIFQSGIKWLDEERQGGQEAFSGNSPSADIYGVRVATRRLELFAKNGFMFSRPGTSLGFITTYTRHDQNSFFGLRQYDALQHSAYVNAIFQSYIGNTNHQYSVGMGWQADWMDESMRFDFRTQPNMAGPSRDEQVPGAFAQYTYTLPNKLVLIGGLRIDHSNLFGTFATPRLHLKYDMTPKTVLRASAGKGYRTSGLWSDYSNLLASSRTWRYNQTAIQEEAWNYGANITQYIHIGGKELTLNAEYYRTDFKNRFVVDYDASVRELQLFESTRPSHADNIQVEASYSPLRGLDLLAAWRWNSNRAFFGDQQRQLPFLSRYKGLMTASYATPLKKWQFDFTLQFNGGGRLPDTSGYPEALRRPNSFGAYQVANTQITKYFKHWNIYAGVENMGDYKQRNPIVDASNPFGEWFDSTQVWGPLMGRKFYVGIRIPLER
ncbi:MAG: TonB-dependent receptor [Breznakibacter sp.]